MVALVDTTSGESQSRCRKVMKEMMASKESHNLKDVNETYWSVKRPWLPGDEELEFPETTVGGHILRVYLLISSSGGTISGLSAALGVIEKLMAAIPNSTFHQAAVGYRLIMDAVHLSSRNLTEIDTTELPLQQLLALAMFGLRSVIAARFGNLTLETRKVPSAFRKGVGQVIDELRGHPVCGWMNIGGMAKKYRVGCRSHLGPLGSRYCRERILLARRSQDFIVVTNASDDDGYVLLPTRVGAALTIGALGGTKKPFTSRAYYRVSRGFLCRPARVR